MSYKGVVSTPLKKHKVKKQEKNMAFAILRAEKLKTMGNMVVHLLTTIEALKRPMLTHQRHLVIFTAYRMPKM